MVQVSHTTRLPFAPERLWRALTDFPASTDWQPAVIEERCEPAGTPAPGSRIYQARRFMGRKITGWSTIEVFEPPVRMCNRGDGVRTEYTLTPAESGAATDLTFTITLTQIPPLMRPLVRRGLRRDVVGRFQRLRTLLEAGRWAEPRS
jgi:hypothetical protein